MRGSDQERGELGGTELIGWKVRRCVKVLADIQMPGGNGPCCFSQAFLDKRFCGSEPGFYNPCLFVQFILEGCIKMVAVASGRGKLVTCSIHCSCAGMDTVCVLDGDTVHVELMSFIATKLPY